MSKEALEKIATVNAMDYEYQAWAREALKQEQGEPVAWADHGVVNWIADKQFKHAALLYEHPPQRTWVGLTDDEMQAVVDAQPLVSNINVYFKAIEAKLKAKNVP